MLMDAVPFWSRENTLYLSVMFYVVVAIGGVMFWVITRTYDLRRRARMYHGVGVASLSAWLLWAVCFSRLFLGSFSLRTAIDGFSRLDWTLLPQAIVWVLGVVAAPAALLFGGFWLWAQVLRRKRESKKASDFFEPIDYQLNWEQILSIPAVVTYTDTRETITTTVGKVLNEILPGRYILPGEPEGEKAPIPESTLASGGSVFITSPSGRTIKVEASDGPKVESKGFAASVVEFVLRLLRLKEGSKYEPVLFFYEFGGFYRYRFFVVLGDKIVADDVMLSTYEGYYFDRNVLQPYYEKEARLMSMEDEDPEQKKRALTWWYRRFYTETTAGQAALHWSRRIFHYTPPERRLQRIEWTVYGIAALLVAHYVFKWF